MNQGNLRRSSRPRGPPKDPFANEFVGDLWKKMQCSSNAQEAASHVSTIERLGGNEIKSVQTPKDGSDSTDSEQDGEDLQYEHPLKVGFDDLIRVNTKLEDENLQIRKILAELQANQCVEDEKCFEDEVSPSAANEGLGDDGSVDVRFRFDPVDGCSKPDVFPWPLRQTIWTASVSKQLSGSSSPGDVMNKIDDPIDCSGKQDEVGIQLAGTKDQSDIISKGPSNFESLLLEVPQAEAMVSVSDSHLVAKDDFGCPKQCSDFTHQVDSFPSKTEIQNTLGENFYESSLLDPKDDNFPSPSLFSASMMHAPCSSVPISHPSQQTDAACHVVGTSAATAFSISPLTQATCALDVQGPFHGSQGIKASIKLLDHYDDPHAPQEGSNVIVGPTTNTSSPPLKPFNQLFKQTQGPPLDFDQNVLFSGLPNKSVPEDVGPDCKVGTFYLDHVPHGPRNANLTLKVPTDLIDDGKKDWETSLVGYFVGRNLPYSLVSTVTNRFWANKGLVDLHATDSGFFFFTFSTVEARDTILEGGPWYIAGQPLILKPWETNLKLDKEAVHTLPVWVNLFGVPLELWNPRGLSFIASYIGKPLKVDRMTASRRRISYARVCVEISGDQDLIKKFALETTNEKGDAVFTDINVEYQWSPPRCSKCSTFGHDCSLGVNPKPVPRSSSNHRRFQSSKSAYKKKEEIGAWQVVNRKDKGKMEIDESSLIPKDVNPKGSTTSVSNVFSVLSPCDDEIVHNTRTVEAVDLARFSCSGASSSNHHSVAQVDTVWEDHVSSPEAVQVDLDVSVGTEVEVEDLILDNPISARQKKKEAKMKFSGSRPKGRHRL